MKKFNLICIIDDDAIYVYGLTKLIGRMQFSEKLIMFSNGKYALQFLVENVEQTDRLPDIILLDVNMPIMDGWEFLDEFIHIKPRFGKKIVVYIITSSIAEQDYKKAKKISVVSDFIVKPVTADQLQKILSDEHSEPFTNSMN